MVVVVVDVIIAVIIFIFRFTPEEALGKAREKKSLTPMCLIRVFPPPPPADVGRSSSFHCLPDLK